MITALVLAAATGLLPLAALPAAAAPAAAPMAGAPCSGASGVTVVVDFGSHGGTVVRCASGDPSSVSEALEAARFSQVRVERQPAFLCRIDGVPSEKDDACVVTPRPEAYWALWTATRGGTWTFASLGVDALDPKPGSVVGFAFGASTTPRVAPPAAAAAPRPSASRTASSAGGSSPTTPPRASSAQATLTPPPSASAPAPTSALTAASTSPLPTAAESSPPSPASSETSLDATPTSAQPDESASGSVGAWVGAAVVVLVGAAAWARASQRRRR